MYNNDTDILIGNNILRFGSNIPKSKSGLYSLFDLTAIGGASVGINQIAYGNAIDGELTSNSLFVIDALGNIGIGLSGHSAKIHAKSDNNLNYQYVSKFDALNKSVLSMTNNGIVSGDGQYITPGTSWSIGGSSNYIGADNKLTVGSLDKSYNFNLEVIAANYPGILFNSVYSQNMNIQQSAGGGYLSFGNSASLNYTNIGPDFIGINSPITSSNLSVRGKSSSLIDFNTIFTNSSNLELFSVRNDGKVLVNQSTSNITDARLQVSGVTNEHGISYYANGLDNTSIGLGIFNQVLNNWSFSVNKGGALQQITTQDNYFRTTGNTSFSATGSGVFGYSKLNTFHAGQHGIAAMVDGTDDEMIGLGVLNTSTLLWKFRVNKDGLIIAPYMPTSSAGLPTGALWNDAGTVKIV